MQTTSSLEYQQSEAWGQYRLNQILIEKTLQKQMLNGDISNNLNYIIVGRSDGLLKIWNLKSNQLAKSIQFHRRIASCKFTDDSQILYVGIYNIVFQYLVNSKFKKLCKLIIHRSLINNILCMSNTLILTSSWDDTIIQTDVNLKQQLLRILAHNDIINGLDYNQKLKIIASSSYDRSIKLWNGYDGSKIIENLDTFNLKHGIWQVLFVMDNNQLISLYFTQSFIIWNINYASKQLEKLLLIDDSGLNISLVLKQKYILTTGSKFIKVYSVTGEFLHQFDLQVQVDDYLCQNVIIHDSTKAVLIIGEHKLYVCNIEKK